MQFVAPDWSAPLRLEELLAKVPANATIRSLFSANLVAAVRAAGKTLPTPRDRYHGFDTIPLREHMRMMVDASRILWPRDPVRIGLRRCGRAVRGSVESTTFGKVTFAGATDGESSLRAMRDTYRAMLGYDVGVDMRGAREAHVTMNDVMYFCDSCHVGVVEGMLKGVGLDPRVEVAMADDWNGVFRVRW